MADLTPDKWQELADKLAAELAQVELNKRQRHKLAVKLMLAMSACGALALALAFIGHSGDWGMLAATPPLLLALFAFSFAMRSFRIAKLAADDMDRISHDIRMWKKRKPA